MTDNQQNSELIQELKGTVSIVINDCYGGFGLSKAAIELYQQLTGDTVYDTHLIPRDDPALIKVVTDLKNQANSATSKLKIVKIPADVKWHIQEYDGIEWIAEDHRTWN